MPPSTRRSGQKRPTTTRPQADPDVPDSSPSRPAAKRRRPAATTTRRRRTKTPEIEPEDNHSADETSSEAEVQTVADAVIPHLAVARAPITVAVEYNNSRAEGNSKVQAYAKVCGRHWTYYVKEVEVVIGRPPDAISRHSSSFGTESSPNPRDGSPEVDIDLGPSKVISRFHAVLFYSMDDQKWHVEVKGRNGVQLNDQKLSCGQQSIVGSGDVLEIGGTQMMFVTAGGKANVHPMFLEQLEMNRNGGGIATARTLSHAHPEPSYTAAPSSSQHRPAVAAISSSQSNGGTAIAPAPPDFVRPTTPTRSPKKSQRTSSAIKQSPVFGRGFMIESTEQIDYSSDATKDMKPTIPYSVMITQAILSSRDETRTLNGIYEWIKQNFAYYRHLSTNWQIGQQANVSKNSIRHVLSLNTCFEKVPRGENEPGKGMKWHIVDEKRAEMITAVAKHMKRSNARPSSLPNSPAHTKDDVTQGSYAPYAPAQPHQSSEMNGVLKTSPPERSPPLTAYPTAQESYTPSRGPRLAPPVNYDHSHLLPALSDDPSPLPIRRNNIRAGVTDSSPVLTSGFFDMPMMTPAPRQHNLNAPLPNTVRLPTSHMPDSSPAPFWKYSGEGGLGSTPARWPEVSPLKGGVNLQSSSPPPGATANGNESPTRGRGPQLVRDMGNSNGDLDEEEGAIDITR
ncbi:MAG: hypothetical protein Q9181_003117 [Wetmoreana brouardii]